MDWFTVTVDVVLLIVLTDSTAATHSVKMIDEALTWSDAGLEVRLGVTHCSDSNTKLTMCMHSLLQCCHCCTLARPVD